MRINEGQNAAAVLFNEVLPVSDEFHIVIVDPFGVPFLQLLFPTRFFLVILHQLHDPIAFVGGFSAVGRITNHAHHRRIAFDLVGFVGFLAQPIGEEGAGIGVVLFEAVGEVHAEALFACGFVAGFGEQEVELEVRHGIAGHEELEAVEPGQEVVFHVIAPDALLPFEALVYLADHFSQKGACAGGRVEDLYLVYFPLFGFAVLLYLDLGFAGIGQSLCEPEFGFEDIVNRPYHEVHHGLGRVPYAAGLAQPGVVMAQKVFVEMDDRVFHAGGFAITLQHFFDIAGQENLHQVVYDPLDALVEFQPGDITEQLLEEGIGLGDEFIGFLAAEGGQGRVVQAGGEHAVGDGLRVHVGKAFGRDIVDEDFTESPHLVFQRAVFVVGFVAVEGFFNDFGEEAGFAGHHLGQFARAADGLPDMRAEIADQVFESRKMLRQGFDAAFGDFSDGDFHHKLPVAVQVKIEVIGKDDVIERSLVAVELFFVAGLLRAFQVFIAQVFGFDEADGNVFAGEDIIGRAAALPFGFVGGAHARHQAFNQLLQIAPERMLGSIAELVTLVDIGDVLV